MSGARRRVPTSTYRVQVREGFDLDAVRELVPQLDDLGVDWVYLSPILTAHPGSDHGYDVVDPRAIDPARGGPEALRRLADVVHGRGMGLLVDVVPNHVGVETPLANPWWADVLTHGRGSAFAQFFDVDWEFGGDRLSIPVVGDDDLLVSPEGGAAIDHLTLDDGELRYHDHRFPVAPGTADDTDDPQVVHGRQHYRLVGWREADHALNYRRFFAVNTLAGVRVEHREVFDAAHAEIGRWFAGDPDVEGGRLVDGLRVDHPDGLRDPAGYLDDLATLTGGAWVLVEKILEPGEDLPTGWATAGTTGYEVLADVDRLFVDPAGEEALTALDERLRGRSLDWAAEVRRGKREVATTILGSEIARLLRELTAELGELDPRAEEALVEVVAAFGVYRSYLPEGREHLDAAVATVRAERPDLADVLDVVVPALADPATAPALRLQQTSGMVMAKGVEDRAFYRSSRLTSLTEVGADPALFSLDADAFHAAMARRQQQRPEAMTTTSTHDTKRGEDVRARISVLAEVPREWADVVDAVLAAVPAPAASLPDHGFVNLLLQAAVGAWPISRERLHAYAEKAMREAQEHTFWTDPDDAYEAAVHALVDALYDDPAARAIVEGIAARLAAPGWSNALSAKLVALTAPGVPDVYQGSELWEQSLVDPDNRRPVDHDLRRRLLAEVGPGDVAAPTALDDDGGAKLQVVRTALRLRREQPGLFGSYAPVGVTGEQAAHAVAFDRGGAVTVATRLPVGLGAAGGWGDTRLDLPPGSWRDLLTDRPAAPVLAELLDRLPVALLVRESASTNGEEAR